MKEDTNHTRDGNSRGNNLVNSHRIKKVAAILVVSAMAALLASCAEDTGDTTGSSVAAPSGSGSSMEGTTGGTTMSGTTMGGTTTGAMMGGGTTGGTTMSGTTSESSTMSTTGDGTTAGTTSDGTTSGNTLTSIQSIVSETDKASLAGRRVQLEGVEVRSSIGNTGFLAGSPGADQVLVVPAEQVNAEQGQTANIEGTLREVPGISEAQQRFGVSEEVAALIQSQVVYLDAQQVQ